MTRDQIKSRLRNPAGYAPSGVMLDKVEAIVADAIAAERERMYAMLEADTSAIWRDQGFRQWRERRKQQGEDCA